MLEPDANLLERTITFNPGKHEFFVTGWTPSVIKNITQTIQKSEIKVNWMRFVDMPRACKMSEIVMANGHHPNI